MICKIALLLPALLALSLGAHADSVADSQELPNPSSHREPSLSTADTRADKAIGKIESCSCGDARIIRGGQTIPLKEPYPTIQVGDRIVCGLSGNVNIVMNDDSKLKIGPNSDLAIESYLLRNRAPTHAVINFLGGSFRAVVTHLYGPADMTIATPPGIIGVRGTTLEVEYRHHQTTVRTIEGEVLVTAHHDGKTATVSTGQQVTMTREGLSSVTRY